MANIKKYFFDFEGVRIPVSALTMRRSRDAIAFCSVTIPEPTDYVDLFNANPNGQMILSHSINGVESVVGTYNLEQIIPTNSPSSFTIVLNGEAPYQSDLPTSGQTFILDNPIYTSQSNGITRAGAAENAIIVVDDILELQGVPYTVNNLSLFVGVKNSRMDLGLT